MTGDRDKLSRMMKELAQNGLTVAFSGGVDSALLLALATSEMPADANNFSEKTRRKVFAVTAQTELSPDLDLSSAHDLAVQFGAEHHAVHINALEDEMILNNSKLRCYYCKRHIFENIISLSSSLGATTVADGTNTDDLNVYRPGLKAIEELGVVSPLVLCGFDKQGVRAYLADLGLEIASKPSAPCLATRFPYGTRLDRDMLHNVDVGEKSLRSMGFDALRLRVHGSVLRIEIPTSDIEFFLSKREQVSRCLHDLGYLYITLDVDGLRSGSMDEEDLWNKHSK